MFKFGMRRRKKAEARVNQCESPFKYTLTHHRIRVRILKSNRKGSKLNVYFKFLIFFFFAFQGTFQQTEICQGVRRLKSQYPYKSP